jgi:hypothetical protein
MALLADILARTPEFGCGSFKKGTRVIFYRMQRGTVASPPFVLTWERLTLARPLNPRLRTNAALQQMGWGPRHQARRLIRRTADG